MQAQGVEFAYDQLKYWLPVAGGFGLVYKIATWLKQIRENDLKHIEAAISNSRDSMQIHMTQQTTAIVAELKELRNDFRSRF